jgi:hypothetical protein
VHPFLAVLGGQSSRIGKAPLEEMDRLERDLHEVLLTFDETRWAPCHSVEENRKEVSTRQVIHIRDPLVQNMYGVTVVVVRRTREDLFHLKIREDRRIPDVDPHKTWVASLRLPWIRHRPLWVISSAGECQIHPFLVLSLPRVDDCLRTRVWLILPPCLRV